MAEIESVRVLIVDDHDMVRRGLAVFLDTFDDMELVGEASDGEEAIRLCGEVKPNVVLIDMLMPGMDGVTAIRLIREEYPDVQAVALTSYKDEQMVKDALEAGAIGYLFKDVSVEALYDALKKASRGEPALATEATQALIKAATQPAAASYHLTDREREVLVLMVEGLTNRQISQEMSLSHSTIKYYVSSILSKLGVASRTEAVALALQHKLI